MTNNGYDNEKPNNKPRQVTPDSFNVSANKPRWHEEASLSFDFENRPDTKPAEPAKPAAPQKRYGLPEEPARPVYRDTATETKPEPEKPSGEPDLKAKAAAFASEKKDAAKAFMQKKMAEIKAASEAARSEAADRRREKAKEEAARARLKAEAEKMAGDAAAEADHQARLDEAVKAKLAAVKKEVKAGKKPKSVTKKSSSGPAIPGLKKKVAKKGVKKGSKKRGKYRWILSALEIILALMIIGGVIGGIYVAVTIAKAPEINPNQIYNTLDVSTHIYDDKGNLTDDIYYEENREIVNYEQLPENLKNAFIAIEDKTFWTHKGFNIKRIFGAILSSLKGGGEISGTSTITQQLARNVFLPEEKSIRSIKRKIIEMYYAHVIEDTLTKEDILTAYLNTIYLGYGCYGVDTASKKYFDVSVEDLSLEQCAALAALPQAPGLYALLMTEPDEAETTTELDGGLWANDVSRERRYIVLDLMAEQGYITQEEADASKRPLEEFIKPGGASSSTNSAFKDYLLETVKHDLMSTSTRLLTRRPRRPSTSSSKTRTTSLAQLPEKARSRLPWSS